ncbi:MAG TPA: PIG-L family deacetylase, partial [Ignavibacteria bacterium]|nr:PIG-L family deacetylase [Ignavibacteria bacterium]
MKKSLFLFLFLALFINLTYTQKSPVGVLRTNLTLLCVAAHPDDEDGATLAYYSKIMGYNAYTIFYTRGEGGQNEIGAELNDELGRIREQECYNAAAIQGSIPYFLGCLDFGYSKTAKETFRFWGGKDSVLQKIVYMIRVIRPDVIISNHDTITTKPNRQHGHHQAVGITIFEAFDKAADPFYHQEQLVNGITPWQIKKLFIRTDDTTKTSGIFTVDIYQNDAAGKTMFETSVEALNQHKTQGMDKLDWKNIPDVAKERHYELIRSDKMYPLEGNDLFEGLVPNEKLDVKLESFTTYYNYKKVNPQDSMRLLK